MLRPLALCATALALGAHSILLPPSVSSSDAEALNIIQIHEKYQVVKLECPSCSAKPDGGDFFTQEIDTSRSLLLNFSTGADPSTLLFGGRPLYPRPSIPHFRTFSMPSSASVQDQSDVKFPLAQLHTIMDYTLDYAPLCIDKTPEVAQVLKMHFQILNLDNKPTALPSLQLVVVELVTGELVIGDIRTGPHIDRMTRPNRPIGWRPHPVDHKHGHLGGHTGRVHRHRHFHHFWSMLLAHVLLPLLIFGVPAGATLFLIVHRIRQAKRARYAQLAHEEEDVEGEVVGSKKMDGYVPVDVEAQEAPPVYSEKEVVVEE
ncbi:hypothetical protein H2201_007512 [Coniosporium apollinis]|uniref:DUF7728 domain-containing protein n=2 Tax=Coniosporium TaxID=2810619 RepID=A0ABQ9NJF2_9PEZI|nr:hypothetical protein H2199_002711 [Cladosporium sp. JES 115]KAJ9659110.1 hypothetical protein H2201_007512 [Coniosporium apollinis]